MTPDSLDQLWNGSVWWRCTESIGSHDLRMTWFFGKNNVVGELQKKDEVCDGSSGIMDKDVVIET